MNHESSSPRHAARPTSHRWKTGANAENLSVDSIISRISKERQLEDERRSRSETVGRHAVAEVASTDTIPAMRRPYSFEDSYRETLDLLNASIERSTGKKYSIEDEARDLTERFDKTLAANGITPAPVAESTPSASPEAVAPVDEPAVETDQYGPVNENLGAVGDEQLKVIDEYQNAVLSSIDLFDKALPSGDIDSEPVVEQELIAAETGSESESESKPSLKERISRLFKRRDNARKRVSLRAKARNITDSDKAESVSARLTAVKFSVNQLGRHIDSWMKKRKYSDGEITVYNDGSSTLAFTLTGSNVRLGLDGKNDDKVNKYARDFTKNGSDTALVISKVGKRYGLGKGYIMDFQTREYYPFYDTDSILLTIGKNGQIPGVGNIGQVSSVELNYKTGNVASDPNAKEIPSPFADFYKFINSIDAEEAASALK